MDGDSIPVPIPNLPASDGLLENPALQEVVDLQTRRDGTGLQLLLESPDPLVRARVALALASVQDPTAFGPLQGSLSDATPEVRRNAAFALGQLTLDDGGAALLVALADEEVPEVRRRLIEALGKRGGADVLSELIGAGRAEEESHRTLAVARAALREVRPPGAIELLVDRLTHPDAEVRSRSAYYFGRAASAAAWMEFAPAVRQALDGYAAEDPAAMHLVQALARLAEPGEDAGRVARWMRSATDWRTRSNAARAVMSPRWLENEEVRDALVLALDDPSEHVRIAAAGSIALLAWSSEEYLTLAEARFIGPVEDWRAQAAFGPPLAGQDRGDLVVDWTRRVGEIDPAGAARGIQMLGGVQGPALVELLFSLADDPDPLPRAAAVNALFQRWARGVLEDGVSPQFYSILTLRLADADNLPAARAAQALGHPAFGPLGSEAVLEEAFASRREEGDLNILVPILESMGGSSVPLLREIVAEEQDIALRAAAARALERLTGEQVPIGAAGDQERWRSVDWERLAAVGTEPRIRIETVRGEMTVRMFTEQAPLTVQTFLDQVEAGEHDGTRFHRVVSNFVAQGGDFGMGEGSGDPGYAIRTESTQLPFERGVMGMASAGKDTENSQYYLTHSSQPHLEGGFTAFGWIERGADVLDRIQEGDRIIRMTIQDR